MNVNPGDHNSQSKAPQASGDETRTAADSAPQRSGSLTEVLKRADSVGSVLFLLFCFTAGCGLPILWASRAFSPTGKVTVSIVVTLYTIAVCWLFYVIMAWSITRIINAL